MTEQILIPILVGLVIAVGLFFLMREVLCWYYKINKRVALQEETNRLLRPDMKCKSCGFTSRQYSDFCPICEKDSKGKTKEEYVAEYKSKS
jgi:hypothetical protein